jgi:hypothetical protein
MRVARMARPDILVEPAHLLYFSRIRAAADPNAAGRRGRLWSHRLQPARLAGDVLIKALYS